ncbi:MAG: hypothetical protein MJZ98_06260 [Paludibacteraceae bacterium]|nr:hypothetical protein [Paludibacteraceae bacterium]
MKKRYLLLLLAACLLCSCSSRYLVQGPQGGIATKMRLCLASCLIPTTKEFMERRWGFGYLIYRFIKKTSHILIVCKPKNSFRYHQRYH